MFRVLRKKKNSKYTFLISFLLLLFIFYSPLIRRSNNNFIYFFLFFEKAYNKTSRLCLVERSSCWGETFERKEKKPVLALHSIHIPTRVNLCFTIYLFLCATTVFLCFVGNTYNNIKSCMRAREMKKKRNRLENGD